MSSPRPASNIRRRAAALAVGLTLAAGGSEVGIRLWFPVLPSLAPAYGYEGRWTDMRGSPETVGAELVLCPPRTFHTAGEGAPVSVWVAGDSTAATLDISPASTWWYRAAVALANGRPLSTVNAASPGANAERLVSELEGVVRSSGAAARPDFVLFDLFADDLEDYQAFSVDQRWVLLPSAAPSWLRPTVAHSWAANLVWYATAGKREARRARRIDDAGLARFDEAIVGAAGWATERGAHYALVLMPAPNLAQCSPGVEPDHPCNSYARDTDTMAARLALAHQPVVDLRPLFAESRFPLTEVDEERLKSGRLRLGIHVGSAGQPAIGAEVVGQLRELRLFDGPNPGEVLPVPVVDPANVPSASAANSAPPASVNGVTALRVAGPEVSRAITGPLEDTLLAAGVRLSTVVAQGGDALRALASGSADVALMARPLRNEETGYVATAFGYAGVAVLVNATNPVDELTRAQLRSLFLGETTSWATLGGGSESVQVVTRRSGPVMKLLGEPLDLQGRTASAAVAIDALSALPAVPGVLVPVTFAELRQRPLGLKPLRIEGTAPDASGVATGGYPLARPLSAVTLGPPSVAARTFIDVLTSAKGQAVVNADFVGTP